jgi:hypothetical protein
MRPRPQPARPGLAQRPRRARLRASSGRATPGRSSPASDRPRRGARPGARLTRKVRSGRDELEMDPEEWAVYLHHLLGVKDGTERLGVLTPEAIKGRTVGRPPPDGPPGQPAAADRVRVRGPSVDRPNLRGMRGLPDRGHGGSVAPTYRPGYRPPWMDRSLCDPDRPSAHGRVAPTGRLRSLDARARGPKQGRGQSVLSRSSSTAMPGAPSRHSRRRSGSTACSTSLSSRVTKAAPPGARAPGGLQTGVRRQRPNIR